MEKYSYSAFAYVYDELMDNVPYDQWAEYLIGLLKENDVSEGLVCELGCGTGQMTRRLAAAGYDMIGIDLSEEMLDVAREQEYGAYEGECDFEEDTDTSEPSILYLQQDMREFELYGTVSAVVSICDSMNYMTSDEDLLQVFRLVNNYLDKDGVFIFDMNTEYKYKELMGDTTIAENREDVSFIWENLYDEEKRLNEYCLTLFAKAETEDEEEGGAPLYEKYEEVHLQRAYPLAEVKRLLAEAGMTFVAAYDVLTHEIPGPECERMYIVAREGHQDGKTYL
ncbi:MAG: class I SAM-dependent methyltransferase [Lachnospiraceae bacterium]|nr:class I SAM-dependent methyltransferase [Lachnospiraceae bacterium]